MKTALRVMAVILGLGSFWPVMGVVMPIYASYEKTHGHNELLELPMLLAVFALAWIVPVMIFWATTEPAPVPKPDTCPNCGGTSHEIVSRATHSYDTTETVTKRITHFSAEHEETGYSEYEVETPVVRSYTNYTHRCTCGHEWIT